MQKCYPDLLYWHISTFRRSRRKWDNNGAREEAVGENPEFFIHSALLQICRPSYIPQYGTVQNIIPSWQEDTLPQASPHRFRQDSERVIKEGVLPSGSLLVAATARNTSSFFDHRVVLRSPHWIVRYQWCQVSCPVSLSLLYNLPSYPLPHETCCPSMTNWCKESRGIYFIAHWLVS